eukprot:m.322714 g.322714  ORF g.322714 m.322714 type:complete len:2341 (-) comp16005_c0_seq10:63-7085(-)
MQRSSEKGEDGPPKRTSSRGAGTSTSGATQNIPGQFWLRVRDNHHRFIQRIRSEFKRSGLRLGTLEKQLQECRTFFLQKNIPNLTASFQRLAGCIIFSDDAQLIEATQVALLSIAKQYPGMFRMPRVYSCIIATLSAEGQSLCQHHKQQTAVMATAVLGLAWKSIEFWPNDFIIAYLEDALGARHWIELPETRSFVKNIQTAWKLDGHAVTPPAIEGSSPAVSESMSPAPIHSPGALSPAFSPGADWEDHDKEDLGGSVQSSIFPSIDVPVGRSRFNDPDWIRSTTCSAIEAQQPGPATIKNIHRLIQVVGAIPDTAKAVMFRLPAWLPALSEDAHYSSLALLVSTLTAKLRQTPAALEPLTRLKFIPLQASSQTEDALLNSFASVFAATTAQGQRQALFQSTLTREINEPTSFVNLAALLHVANKSARWLSDIASFCHSVLLSHKDPRVQLRNLIRKLRKLPGFDPEEFCAELLHKAGHIANPSQRQQVSRDTYLVHFLECYGQVLLLFFIDAQVCYEAAALSLNSAKGQRADTATITDPMILSSQPILQLEPSQELSAAKLRVSKAQLSAVVWLQAKLSGGTTPLRGGLVSHILRKLFFDLDPTAYFGVPRDRLDALDGGAFDAVTTCMPVQAATIKAICAVALNPIFAFPGTDALPLLWTLVHKATLWQLVCGNKDSPLSITPDTARHLFIFTKYVPPKPISPPATYASPSFVVSHSYGLFQLILTAITICQPSVAEYTLKQYPSIKELLLRLVSGHMLTGVVLPASSRTSGMLTPVELRAMHNQIVVFERYVAEAFGQPPPTIPQSQLIGKIVPLRLPNGTEPPIMPDVQTELANLDFKAGLRAALLEWRKPDLLLEVVAEDLQRAKPSDAAPLSWLGPLAQRRPLLVKRLGPSIISQLVLHDISLSQTVDSLTHALSGVSEPEFRKLVASATTMLSSLHPRKRARGQQLLAALSSRMLDACKANPASDVAAYVPANVDDPAKNLTFGQQLCVLYAFSFCPTAKDKAGRDPVDLSSGDGAGLSQDSGGATNESLPSASHFFSSLRELALRGTAVQFVSAVECLILLARRTEEQGCAPDPQDGDSKETQAKRAKMGSASLHSQLAFDTVAALTSESKLRPRLINSLAMSPGIALRVTKHAACDDVFALGVALMLPTSGQQKAIVSARLPAATVGVQDLLEEGDPAVLPQVRRLLVVLLSHAERKTATKLLQGVSEQHIASLIGQLSLGKQGKNICIDVLLNRLGKGLERSRSISNAFDQLSGQQQALAILAVQECAREGSDEQAACKPLLDLWTNSGSKADDAALKDMETEQDGEESASLCTQTADGSGGFGLDDDGAQEGSSDEATIVVKVCASATIAHCSATCRRYGRSLKLKSEEDRARSSMSVLKAVQECVSGLDGGTTERMEHALYCLLLLVETLWSTTHAVADSVAACIFALKTAVAGLAVKSEGTLTHRLLTRLLGRLETNVTHHASSTAQATKRSVRTVTHYLSALLNEAASPSVVLGAQGAVSLLMSHESAAPVFVPCSLIERVVRKVLQVGSEPMFKLMQQIQTAHSNGCLVIVSDDQPSTGAMYTSTGVEGEVKKGAEEASGINQAVLATSTKLLGATLLNLVLSGLEHQALYLWLAQLLPLADQSLRASVWLLFLQQSVPGNFLLSSHLQTLSVSQAKALLLQLSAVIKNVGGQKQEMAADEMDTKTDNEASRVMLADQTLNVQLALRVLSTLFVHSQAADWTEMDRQVVARAVCVCAICERSELSDALSQSQRQVMTKMTGSIDPFCVVARNHVELVVRVLGINVPDKPIVVAASFVGPVSPTPAARDAVTSLSAWLLDHANALESMLAVRSNVRQTDSTADAVGKGCSLVSRLVSDLFAVCRLSLPQDLAHESSGHRLHASQLATTPLLTSCQRLFSLMLDAEARHEKGPLEGKFWLKNPTKQAKHGGGKRNQGQHRKPLGGQDDLEQGVDTKDDSASSAPKAPKVDSKVIEQAVNAARWDLLPEWVAPEIARPSRYELASLSLIALANEHGRMLCPLVPTMTQLLSGLTHYQDAELVRRCYDSVFTDSMTVLSLILCRNLTLTDIAKEGLVLSEVAAPFLTLLAIHHQTKNDAMRCVLRRVCHFVSKLLQLDGALLASVKPLASILKTLVKDMDTARVLQQSVDIMDAVPTNDGACLFDGSFHKILHAVEDECLSFAIASTTAEVAKHFLNINTTRVGKLLQHLIRKFELDTTALEMLDRTVTWLVQSPISSLRSYGYHLLHVRTRLGACHSSDIVAAVLAALRSPRAEIAQDALSMAYLAFLSEANTAPQVLEACLECASRPNRRHDETLRTLIELINIHR